MSYLSLSSNLQILLGMSFATDLFLPFWLNYELVEENFNIMPAKQYLCTWSCAQILYNPFCYQGWSIWDPKTNFSTCAHYSVFSFQLKDVCLAILLVFPISLMFFLPTWTFLIAPKSALIFQIFSKTLTCLNFLCDLPSHFYCLYLTILKRVTWILSPIPLLPFLIEVILIICFPPLLYWNCFVNTSVASTLPSTLSLL